LIYDFGSAIELKIEHWRIISKSQIVGRKSGINRQFDLPPIFMHLWVRNWRMGGCS
jgi:hypothetical protein